MNNIKSVKDVCLVLLNGLVILLLLPSPSKSSGERIVLSSDQPGIVGSNVTLYAQLEGAWRDLYTIVWYENFPRERQIKKSLSKSNNYTSNWTTTHDYPGNFTVTVIVFYTVVFDWQVASALLVVEIKENFVGVLDISQPGAKHRKDPASVSIFNETIITANVHDPSNYLHTASNVTYTWFKNGTVVNVTSSPTLHMNFTHEDVYPIRVNLSAVFNESGKIINRNGSFAQDISAKVPLVNFTISGATWFRHGKLLDIGVNCDGSPPFEYCWIIKYGPYNQTGNETCEPAVTTDCSIKIYRYLESGTYNLLIRLNNDVSSIANQTGIHVYKTTTKPQLSIIIVPISCTLIAIVLIIFGVAYYWENHVRYSVEVADFDFGMEEAPYVRFLDRLREAVSSSVAVQRGRRSSLLLPPDDESNIVRYGTVKNIPL